MKHKTIFIALIILLILVFTTFFTVFHVRTQMKDLFRMNKDLQKESYYMGNFELKMLSLAYYLDKGHYFKALSGINKLHKQLEIKENLIKVPEFNNKEEELEFYLSLQNPKTGAFIDDSIPYFTYNEMTENILIHLDALTQEMGRPLQLKYPLKYLDEINTPEKLTTFLDDVSHVAIGSLSLTNYLIIYTNDGLAQLVCQ